MCHQMSHSAKSYCLLYRKTATITGFCLWDPRARLRWLVVDAHAATPACLDKTVGRIQDVTSALRV